jgi:phosphoenolpyruvate carboxylase
MKESFDQAVSTRYHIYNSLFLNLPFSNVYRTGTLLPLFQQAVESGFQQGKSPEEILTKFFTDYANEINPEEQFDLLFNFIQYVERQVVLFDSIEDAAFDTLNDRKGKGTLSALLLRAAAEGSMDTLGKKVEDFKMRLVLTAHPTQFYPGHVLAIINDLEQAIRDNALNNINLLLQQLGKTGFINREKPTPFDEAVSLCWYLENVFYQSVPDIISGLSQGLKGSSNNWRNHDLITIGFWPGGDRDGNPFVTSDITLRVAERLRETILRCYHRDVRQLKRRLTFRGVEEIIISVERKIYNTLFTSKNGYENPDQLVKELATAREVLVQEHNSLFLDQLDSFLLKVNLFGFFFASLDIRQDSRNHTQAWEDLLPKAASKKLAKLNPAEQISEILNTKLTINLKRLKDTTAEDVVGSLMAVKEIQQRNGEKACHRYVISNCRSAGDIIRVFQLARLIFNESKNLPLDVIPLFETIDDLMNAEKIMEELYSITAYKAHLKKRKNKQTIMLGFSDGTKDGGYLKANWSIFKAKENLTRVSRKHDIDALFFDGRGGPPARGGGNTHDFYASLGNQIESKEIQITIQGQTISSGFGKPASCQYNLEQLLSAGIENEVFNATDELTQEDKLLIDQLANEGYKAYLELKHHPLFVPYLEKVTPLLLFGETNIGSRPTKRSSTETLSLDDLRAIPFVGTWAQMKQNIPGFYGVGSALRALQQDGKWKQLQDLYKRSLFFRTLLGNSMMSLRKTYYPATRHLQHDTMFGELWKMMYGEYKLSVEKILSVSGMNELMENNPLNRDSIQLRERIVLPLIAIQQYALQNLRKKNPEKENRKYRQLVLRCTFGIINAGRNSA